MANEFARNLQDGSLNPATWALPTQASANKVSATVDLGVATFRNAQYEIELSVPTLTDTMAPAAATAGVTYSIEESSTSTFAAVDTIFSRNLVGTGSGIAATVVRARVPSNGGRYLRGKVALGTTCADASTIAATLTLRF